MDYDFGPKRNWRRWMWNRISERVTDRKNALCVYLGGKENFDIVEAERRGFRGHNMLCVERSKCAANEIRGNGNLVILGDFFDALFSVQRRQNVSVVYADLCCGLSPELIHNVFISLGSENLSGAVFAFNLLRGRDPKMSKIRPLMEWSFSEIAEIFSVSTKHRGFQLCNALMARCGMNSETHPANGRSVEELAADESFCKRAEFGLKHMYSMARPVFESYLSQSGQQMDSVVFSNPVGQILKRDELMSPARYSGLIKERGEKALRTQRSAAAILAHRTMRLSRGLA